MPRINTAARCMAGCFLPDERWGGFTRFCEAVEGHDGPHIAEMNACTPKAWMSWIGDVTDHVGPDDPRAATSRRLGAESEHEHAGAHDETGTP